jgi:hypothetical protein
MTLPFDVARCAGRYAEAKSRPLTTAVGHVDCVRCLRRTEPWHPTYQVHMEPPAFVDGQCPERIEPDSGEAA